MSKNEKGLSRCNGNSPKDGITAKPHACSIPQLEKKVKGEPLKEFRQVHNLSGKEVIKEVQRMFPRYDKTLQSKCERSLEYGIQIRPEAMLALYEKFAPEEVERYKHKRRGGHRLTCRIGCRLEDDEYNKLVTYIKEEGYATMQDWLQKQVKDYLSVYEYLNQNKE